MFKSFCIRGPGREGIEGPLTQTLRLAEVPGRQRCVWSGSGACYCAAAGTRGFAQMWGHPQGYCGWNSSPDAAAPGCEANPWGRHSGCYLTSPDTPSCSVGCQKRRGSHEISSWTSQSCFSHSLPLSIEQVSFFIFFLSVAHVNAITLTELFSLKVSKTKKNCQRQVCTWRSHCPLLHWWGGCSEGTVL